MAKKNKAKTRAAAKSRVPGKKVSKKAVRAKVAAAVEAKGIKPTKAAKLSKPAPETKMPSAADVAIKLGLPAPIAASKSIDLIKPDPKNPRAFGHSEEMIAEMAAVLKSTGQLQPVGLVEDTKGNGYRLIWGHLRYLGAKKAGLKMLDARVFSELSEEQIAVAQSIENFTRKEPTVLDEALAVDRLTQGRAARQELTVEDVKRVAGLLGWHERRVRRCEKLLRLQPAGRAARLLAEGRLTIHQAESISTLADPKLQDDVAEMAARNEDGSGGWSEFAVSKWVMEHRRNLRGVPWLLDVEFAGKPACATCPNNAKNKRGLFDGLVDKGVGYNERYKLELLSGTSSEDPGMCLLSACFDVKTNAAKRKIDAAVDRSKTRMVELTTSAKKNAEAGNYEFKPVAVTATTLERESLIPEGIKPATLVNQVRKVLPASITGGGKSEGDGDLNGLPKPNLAGKAAGGKKQVDPREVAKQRHEDAMRKWQDDLQAELVQITSGHAMRLAALFLFVETELFSRMEQSYGDKAIERVLVGLASPKAREILDGLSNPTPEVIERIAFDIAMSKEKGRIENLLWGPIEGLDPRVLAVLVKHLGGDPKSEPKLETFLTDVGERADEPAAAGKASKGKGGRKKTKTDAEIADEIDADGGAPEGDVE